MAYIHQGPDLALDRNQTKIVPADSLDAAWVLVVHGGTAPDEDVKKWKLDEIQQSKQSWPGWVAANFPPETREPAQVEPLKEVEPPSPVLIGKPLITLTPEQLAEIERLRESGDIEGAKAIVMTVLDAHFLAPGGESAEPQSKDEAALAEQARQEALAEKAKAEELANKAKKTTPTNKSK